MNKPFAALIATASALSACGGGGGDGGGQLTDQDRAAFETAVEGAVRSVAYSNASKLLADALLPMLSMLRTDRQHRMPCSNSGSLLVIEHTDSDADSTISGGDVVNVTLDACSTSMGRTPYAGTAQATVTTATVSGVFSGSVFEANLGSNGRDLRLALSGSGSLLINETVGGAQQPSETLNISGSFVLGGTGDTQPQDRALEAPAAVLFTDSPDGLQFDSDDIVLRGRDFDLEESYAWNEGQNFVYIHGLIDAPNESPVTSQIANRNELSGTSNGNRIADIQISDTDEVAAPEGFGGSISGISYDLQGTTRDVTFTVGLPSAALIAEATWSDFSDLWFAPRADLKVFSVLAAAPTLDAVQSLQGNDALRIQFSREFDLSTAPTEMSGTDPDNPQAPADTVTLSPLGGRTSLDLFTTEDLEPGFVYTVDLSAMTDINGNSLQASQAFGTEVTVIADGP